ncbi:hypothetical protein [Geodermatophilus marinus]|uniref:hypothetical protein n=1 Tax=Geodermatophilus sp. LHW52908 TaxID=2303986 RepID=UPI000E3BC926|nr:hypothetical protein [Geodermatophilus sp. LHW52908]RFU21832.1 hypothetical protein D0Z06_09410 [Geodermatophilus sp. LHW52908]
MAITTSRLIRACGLSAVLAGLLYIVIQFVHPTEDVAAVTGSAWLIVGAMTLAFAVLGLIGVTGIYLRQVQETGVLGLVGHLLTGTFFLLATAFTFAETFVLPPLVPEAPAFVDSFLGVFADTGGDVDLGALRAMGGVSFALYLLGGVLLGSAVVRARVLSRGAGALLVAGAACTLLVPLVPHALGRYAAVPYGAALIWLGYSLWTEQRRTAPTTPPSVGRARATA